MTGYYYLIANLPYDEAAEKVNQKYAPQFGMSVHFTADNIAKLLGIKREAAMRKIRNWMDMDICREVIA
jgi:hypothetical protein